MTTMIPEGLVAGDYTPPANLDDPYGLLYLAEHPPPTPPQTRGRNIMSVLEELPVGSVIEERRSSGQVAEVRFPDRIITIMAVPYDEITDRVNERFKESFAPGSFNGIESRNDKIRVNREHVVGQPVGRITRWYVDRPEGLVGELKVSETLMGDETLALADDGVLDASVGFWPLKNGIEWLENRSHRRITKAWLHHLALTADPAYSGAQVLEVRQQTPPVPPAPTSATPNLDAINALLMERGQLRGFPSQPPTD